MSIDSKHTYRFRFLKSDKWKTLRLEALVQANAKCCVCGYESISNDAHHVYYPPNYFDTEQKDLVILCRRCHNLIHVLVFVEEQNRKKKFARFEEVKAALIKWIQSSKDPQEFIEIAIPQNKRTACFCCRRIKKPARPVNVMKRYGDEPLKRNTWRLCSDCKASMDHEVDWPETRDGAFVKIREWYNRRKLSERILLTTPPQVLPVEQ